MSRKFMNIKYEITKLFISGLRTIFEKDSQFTYNKDVEKSTILITRDYPRDQKKPMLKPQLVLANINTSHNPQNTFLGNFYKDRELNGMKDGVQDYAYIIPYNITLLCVADQYTSEDLASSVVDYLTFSAFEYLSNDLALNINNVQLGHTTPSKQFPEKVFDTMVSVSGTVYWIGSREPYGVINEAPLNKVGYQFEEIVEV